MLRWQWLNLETFSDHSVGNLPLARGVRSKKPILSTARFALPMYIFHSWDQSHSGPQRQVSALLIRMLSGSITIFYMKIKTVKTEARSIRTTSSYLPEN